MYTPVKRYHRIDGWRGYFVPAYAVAGTSDTGMWSDSPCPSNEVKAEIRRFMRECLKPLGIKARTRYGTSSNVFCAKRWVVVGHDDFDRAAQAADAWLAAHERDTHYLHDADLDKCKVAE